MAHTVGVSDSNHLFNRYFYLAFINSFELWYYSPMCQDLFVDTIQELQYSQEGRELPKQRMLEESFDDLWSNSKKDWKFQLMGSYWHCTLKSYCRWNMKCFTLCRVFVWARINWVKSLNPHFFHICAKYCSFDKSTHHFVILNKNCHFFLLKE